MGWGFYFVNWVLWCNFPFWWPEEFSPDSLCLLCISALFLPSLQRFGGVCFKARSPPQESGWTGTVKRRSFLEAMLVPACLVKTEAFITWLWTSIYIYVAKSKLISSSQLPLSQISKMKHQHFLKQEVEKGKWEQGKLAVRNSLVKIQRDIL